MVCNKISDHLNMPMRIGINVLKQVVYHSCPVYEEQLKFYQSALKFPNNFQWQFLTIVLIGYIFPQDIMKELILEYKACQS